jgi:hypothetical protein
LDAPLQDQGSTQRHEPRPNTLFIDPGYAEVNL